MKKIKEIETKIIERKFPNDEEQNEGNEENEQNEGNEQKFVCEQNEISLNDDKNYFHR